MTCKEGEHQFVLYGHMVVKPNGRWCQILQCWKCGSFDSITADTIKEVDEIIKQNTVEDKK